jgi:hypothetical protein
LLQDGASPALQPRFTTWLVRETGWNSPEAKCLRNNMEVWLVDNCECLGQTSPHKRPGWCHRIFPAWILRTIPKPMLTLKYHVFPYYCSSEIQFLQVRVLQCFCFCSYFISPLHSDLFVQTPSLSSPASNRTSSRQSANTARVILSTFWVKRTWSLVKFGSLRRLYSRFTGCSLPEVGSIAETTRISSPRLLGRLKFIVWWLGSSSKK